MKMDCKTQTIRSGSQKSPSPPRSSCIILAFCGCPPSSMTQSARQLPRKMHMRWMLSIGGICHQMVPPYYVCGTMMWDGQLCNHTFQLLSKHGVSPCWATLPELNMPRSFLLGELEEIIHSFIIFFNIKLTNATVCTIVKYIEC